MNDRPLPFRRPRHTPPPSPPEEIEVLTVGKIMRVAQETYHRIGIFVEIDASNDSIHPEKDSSLADTGIDLDDFDVAVRRLARTLGKGANEYGLNIERFSRFVDQLIHSNRAVRQLALFKLYDAMTKGAADELGILDELWVRSRINAAILREETWKETDETEEMVRDELNLIEDTIRIIGRFQDYLASQSDLG